MLSFSLQRILKISNNESQNRSKITKPPHGCLKNMIRIVIVGGKSLSPSVSLSLFSVFHFFFLFLITKQDRNTRGPAHEKTKTLNDLWMWLSFIFPFQLAWGSAAPFWWLARKRTKYCTYVNILKGSPFNHWQHLTPKQQYKNKTTFFAHYSHKCRKKKSMVFFLSRLCGMVLICNYKR